MIAASNCIHCQADRTLHTLEQRDIWLTEQAELKVGDKLSDFPDYYRVLPAAAGPSVALSKFLDKSPVNVPAHCPKPCLLTELICRLTPLIAERSLSVWLNVVRLLSPRQVVLFFYPKAGEATSALRRSARFLSAP